MLQNPSKIEKIIDNYKNWYAQNIRLYEEVLTENGKVFEVHIPAFNKNGEGLSFYISCQREKIIVTDAGFVVSNIILNGFNLTESKIETIKSIINHYGLGFDENDNEIYLEILQSDYFSFNQKFQNLIYAVQIIDSLQIIIN